MATRRFSYLDDIVLKTGNIGINTSSPTTTVQFVGTCICDNLIVSGVTTSISFDGFLNTNKNIQSTTIDSGTSSSLSGEIVVGVGNTLTIDTDAISGQGSIDSMKVSNTFNPPIGGINDRPSAPKPGSLYYNKDFRTIEYWDGNFWRQVDNRTSSGRGVFGGKNGGGGTQFLVDSIQISTKGNSVDWGTMLRGRYVGQNCVGGETRVIFAGGYGLSPSPETSDLNAMDYGTFASGGQCIDFGNLTDARRGTGGCGSSTRGIIWGGESAPNQLIDYFEIATIGNALEFQDLGGSNTGGQMCCSSPTRGIAESSNVSEGLRYIIIASKGSHNEFGNYINSSYMGGFVSNGTRGVIAGGYNPLTPAGYNQKEIGYINLASTGNASYFGDLTSGRGTSGVSDRTRGVFGTHNPSNIIDYINFASQGNAEDFGDLTYTHTSSQICGSDSHGGLGGF